MMYRVVHRSILGASFLAVAVALLGTCTEERNEAPAIEVLDTTPPFGDAPVSGVVYWRVSDPDGDRLTCELDFDGDGRADETVTDCGTEHDGALRVLGTRQARDRPDRDRR